ncbi:MAG TPA: TIGR03936 family radical SAM-associated protein [Micromonosporaceae bacterium]|nr:TIGR03936 family radical SAM-associated protein [Micromonosporaceae bacterium]
MRIKYAKRGPMRFTSHRDFARALERAVRRAGIPVAFSQGFTPHPKISYASAAPTGAASEAEFLEIGLQAPMDADKLREALDAALSPGLDILAAVPADGGPGLAELIDASRWRVELPGVAPAELERAVAAFQAAPEVTIERLTKQGKRSVDIRTAVVRIAALPADAGAPPADTKPAGTAVPAPPGAQPCAILDVVVRQVTPSVRPDDVLAGLRVVADLVPPVPPRATRLAQGRLTDQGDIVDPLVAGGGMSNDGASIGDPSEQDGQGL